MPVRPSSWKSAMTSTLVRESRLPVGSSARRMRGRLTRARAMATRCCWPPEIWLGWWSSAVAQARPARSASRARACRSRAGTPA